MVVAQRAAVRAPVWKLKVRGFESRRVHPIFTFYPLMNLCLNRVHQGGEALLSFLKQYKVVQLGAKKALSAKLGLTKHCVAAGLITPV